MTESDPAHVFRRRVAGKTITVETGPLLVEGFDGPRGIEPSQTVRYAFDEDGICCPVWETDQPTDGEQTK